MIVLVHERKRDEGKHVARETRTTAFSTTCPKADQQGNSRARCLTSERDRVRAAAQRSARICGSGQQQPTASI